MADAPDDAAPHDAPPPADADAEAGADTDGGSPPTAPTRRSPVMRVAVWGFRLFTVAVVVWIALQVEFRDTIETVDRGPVTGTIVREGHAPGDDGPGHPWVIRVEEMGDEVAIGWREIRRHDHLHLADGSRVTGTITDVGSDGSITLLQGEGEDRTTRTLAPADIGADGWHYGRPKITRGLLSLAGQLDLRTILIVLGALVLVLVFSSLRWWTLATSVGVDMSYRDAVRLMAIGLFYMYAPGGITTGDLIKAMYLRRHTKRTTQALVSVFADRLLGLQTMLLMGLVATMLFGWQLVDRRPAFRGVMIATVVLAALGGTVGLMMLSSRVRSWFGISRWLRRGPLARIVDELSTTLASYRNTHGSVLLAAVWSLASQIPQVMMAAAFGAALGIDVPLWQYFVLIPMASVIGAIPGLPGGLGLMEGGYVAFFAFTLAPEELSRALALSLLMRLSLMVLSAVGFYEAMTFGRRLRAREESGSDTGGDSTPAVVS